jgi:AbrB family transcriptional regulator, stage V sporulation protein T
MKVTGIVRRVDDLGRIVIPKEIRRSLRIKEGDPLEIFISRDGEIIFKKYDDGQAANEWIEGNSIK